MLLFLVLFFGKISKNQYQPNFLKEIGIFPQIQIGKLFFLKLNIRDVQPQIVQMFMSEKLMVEKSLGLKCPLTCFSTPELSTPDG